jgi:hypothetical protein
LVFSFSLTPLVISSGKHQQNSIGNFLGNSNGFFFYGHGSNFPATGRKPAVITNKNKDKFRILILILIVGVRNYNIIECSMGDSFPAE